MRTLQHVTGSLSMAGYIDRDAFRPYERNKVCLKLLIQFN